MFSLMRRARLALPQHFGTWFWLHAKVACILQTESSHTLRFFGKPRSQT